jgi:hypothetical protein
MKPIVYIASPYTKGDPCVNTYCQMQMFNDLLDDELVTPYIPLLSHYLHTFRPRPYEDWIGYDLEMLRAMDCCLRINAVYPAMQYKVTESTGADNEVKWFLEHGKPVFYDKAALYVWVKENYED